jgi:acetyl-CoA C-acetyltransferase
MRDVYVVGIGITSFTRLEYPVVEIAAYPGLMAMRDAGLQAVDHVYVANMGASRLNKQTGLASAVVDHLSLCPAGAEGIENGPASGASAIKEGFMAVASGMHDTVMCIGAERMREANALETTDFVATLSHPMAEYIYGVTLPSLAGMFMRLYEQKYGVTGRHTAMVAVKNHAHAMDNFYAHLHEACTLEGIYDGPEAWTNNPFVSDPLRYYDCCPVSDGAACLILGTGDVAKKLGKPMIRLAGVGQATDFHAIHERPEPTDLLAVREAARKCFTMANLSPKDVNVAELHDAFSILEIVESEEVGFFNKGEGHIALQEGATKIGGLLPINPSGGLKAKGHPVGATGVGQAHEIVLQLRGGAEKRQVKDARVGFTCNFGGFGNNVVCLAFVKES